MVVIPSEFIQIISAGIYPIALFYTIVTYRRTKRLDRITLLNKIFSDRELDSELDSIPLGSQYDNARRQWYSHIFNSVNWLSFMINEKVISDKKMIEHIKHIIIKYYGDIFLKNVSVNEINSIHNKNLKNFIEQSKVGINEQIN